MATSISFVGTAVLLRVFRHLDILDVPNERSAHITPTVKGGGLALALSCVVVLVVVGPVASPLLVILVATAGAYGLIGLADDLRGVPPLARLALQIVVACAALPALSRGLTGGLAWRVTFIAGCALWLIAYVNAFNFMDGIDGIAVAQTISASVTWMLIGLMHGNELLVVGSGIVAAAALGFAPFNIPNARIFLGDVGSYFLGGWLGVLMVIGLRVGIEPEAMVAPVAIYLADTAMALVRKARSGRALYLPHRDHVYQRLVALGWSHLKTSFFYLGCVIVCSALGGLSQLAATPVRIFADASLLLVIIAYLRSPEIVGRIRR